MNPLPLSSYVAKFTDHIHNIQNRIINEQGSQIAQAAQILTNSFLSGHNIFAFGPGHAGMFAEEMFYRAGGLAITNPLFHSGVMTNERPITLTSALEILPGYASVILRESPLKAGDVLMIHSVAGRNPVAVELAISARQMDVIVIGITSMDYAEHVDSRDPSGKKLHEVSDLVIDTCGDLGDASISMDGVAQKVAPTSSILGSFIANCILIQTCQYLLDAGVIPPVFQSANVDGGAAYNASLLEQYSDRIFYMK